MEQLESLGVQLDAGVRQTSHVTARTREAAHKTGSDRVGDRHEHDRDRRGRFLRRRHAARRGHDDIDGRPDQLCGEFVSAFAAALSEAIVDDDVLSLDVSKLTEPERRRFIPR
jgi:hypothetical protein